jgi:orotate phosphoribosyltransferase
MENTGSTYGGELAKAGLAIRAFKLSPAKPFLWASGYYMPIYNDNRMFLFYPPYRKLITDAFERLIRETAPGFDVIAGTSTSGIPYGTMVAERMEAPFVYVRSKAKGHGRANRIEGIDGEDGLAGKKVILIEDLISTGQSSADAVKALREGGGDVALCVSIFSYGLEESTTLFQSLAPPCRDASLLCYDGLIIYAEQSGYLSGEEKEILTSWRKDPFSWGAAHGFPPAGKGEKG